MKYAAALIALFALTACNSNKTLQGATGYIQATQGQPEPVEGVYPDCKYGVVPPDEGTGPACMKPRD